MTIDVYGLIHNTLIEGFNLMLMKDLINISFIDVA